MRTTCLTFFIIAAIAIGAQGQSRDDERDSLAGLTGVMIVVEALHPDADIIELGRDDIEREILYRLKRAGIAALTPQEREADPRKPYLYVNCNVLYVPDIQLTSFSIDVELHQQATLKNGRETAVLTWARSYLGVQHRERAAAAIRGRLGELLEQFISDVEAVNRKSKP